MSVVDRLIEKYRNLVSLPWSETVAGPERVWMLVYPPRDERRLRAKIGEFEIATTEAGHGWRRIDFTAAFGEWIGDQEYRESYFEHPEDMTLMLDVFGRYLEEKVVEVLDEADDKTVVGVMGLGGLFGLYSVSSLLEAVNHRVKGRLLAFFPGVRDGNNYRLLDAKDGWSYMAIPIDVTEDEHR